MKLGYASFLSSSGEVSILRTACLGASPSVIAPFFVDDNFFIGCEFCIIDLSVIDQVSTSWLAYDMNSVIRWMDWVCHMSRRNRCQPIILVIPLLQNVRGENVPIRLALEVATRLECFYLDARELARSAVEGGSLSAEDLYSDAAHPNAAFSNQISRAILNFFKRNEISYQNEAQQIALERVGILKLKDHAPAPFRRVNYTNQLFSFSGIRLNLGEAVEIRTGTIYALHAIMVNSARSNCKILIEGNRSVVKSINLKPFLSGEFEARLVPFRSPMRDKEGMLRIAVAPDYAPSCDRTMQEQVEFLPGPRFCEISEILVDTGFIKTDYVAQIPRGSKNILMH